MMASIPVAAFSLFPKIDCASDDMAYTKKNWIVPLFFLHNFGDNSWNQFCVHRLNLHRNLESLFNFHCFFRTSVEVCWHHLSCNLLPRAIGVLTHAVVLHGACELRSTCLAKASAIKTMPLFLLSTMKSVATLLCYFIICSLFLVSGSLYRMQVSHCAFRRMAIWLAHPLHLSSPPPHTHSNAISFPAMRKRRPATTRASWPPTRVRDCWCGRSTY